MPTMPPTGTTRWSGSRDSPGAISGWGSRARLRPPPPPWRRPAPGTRRCAPVLPRSVRPVSMTMSYTKGRRLSWNGCGCGWRRTFPACRHPISTPPCAARARLQAMMAAARDSAGTCYDRLEAASHGTLPFVDCQDWLRLPLTNYPGLHRLAAVPERDSSPIRRRTRSGPRTISAAPLRFPAFTPPPGTTSFCPACWRLFRQSRRARGRKNCGSVPTRTISFIKPAAGLATPISSGSATI